MENLASPWNPRYCVSDRLLWYTHDFMPGVWSTVLSEQFKKNLIFRAMLDNMSLTN